jgi:hypothetical protein
MENGKVIVTFHSWEGEGDFNQGTISVHCVLSYASYEVAIFGN